MRVCLLLAIAAQATGFSIAPTVARLPNLQTRSLPAPAPGHLSDAAHAHGAVLRMVGRDDSECLQATRRELLGKIPGLAASSMAAASLVPASVEAAASETDLQDGRWWVFPLAPYQRKKTVRTEAIPGQVWTFDQIIGALYVHVPLRMTIVKLSKGGGLLAFCPVNPTPEALKLVRELEAEHGPLKYIVLGSAAIEHKVAAGPFARAFPAAELWVAPDQYSFPFDWDNLGRGPEGLGRLDLTQLFFGLRPKPLPRSSTQGSVPWADDLEHVVLGPLKSRGGQAPGLFEDVALFHKPSRTLLITDLIQTAPSKIPEVVLNDPRALLFHARDNAFDKVEDSAETRQRGWERIALFSLFFQPGGLNIIPWGQAFQDLKGGQVMEMVLPRKLTKQACGFGAAARFWVGLACPLHHCVENLFSSHIPPTKPTPDE